MYLRSYSDGSYVSVYGSRCHAGEYNFMGWKKNQWRINSGVSARSTIMDCIVSSAAECEYGSLFMNARRLVWLPLIASELGYPQECTEIFCDNTCAIGLAHDSTGMGKSKAMDMRFHWIRDRVKQDLFKVTYIKSEDNVADMFTKFLPAADFKRQSNLINSSFSAR